MRKCEKKKLKKVRYHENLCRAKRKVDDIAADLGFDLKKPTREEMISMIKTLSNKTVRSLANASGSLMDHSVRNPDIKEFVQLLVDEQAERTLKFEEERKRG